jgi:integrase
MIGGRLYRRPLRIRRGEESMLSARLAQVTEEILSGHFNIPIENRQPVLLSEYIKEYEKRKAYKKSLDRDMQRLPVILRILGDRPLHTYRPENFRQLEKELFELGKKGLSSATVNRYFQLLRHLFELAIQDGLLKENPLRSFQYFVEDRESGRSLSEDEIKILVKTLRVVRDGARRRDHVRHILLDLVLFGLHTGMRLSEIINLQHANIDGDLVKIPITETKYRRRGGKPKSKFKLIILSPAALGIIGRQPSSNDGYVFKLRRRDSRVVSEALVSLRPKIGIPDFHFHLLRHTFSTMVAGSTDMATARVLLGHSDYRTTLRYTHPDLEKRRAVVTSLDTRLSKVLPSD